VNDVFYLTPEELQNGRDAPLKSLVAERKAQMEHFSHITPAPMLGTPPAFDMGDGGPMMRAMVKGEMTAPNTSPRQANMVQG